MEYKLGEKLTAVGSNAFIEIGGRHNAGTHINFIREINDIFFTVKIKDKDKEKTIVLPEWFIDKFFTAEKAKVEDLEIVNLYKRV